MIQATTINYRNKVLKVAFLMLFLVGTSSIIAQENPPVPIKVEVRTARNLNFGSFVVDPMGGNLTVDHTGVLTNSTDIFHLGTGAVNSALFDVYANPGTIVYIQDQGEITLKNQNGNGGIIFLNINSFSTGDRTFVTWEPSADIPNEVFVGGTLRIPADNSGTLSGQYNGTFTLTFIHQ